MNFANSISIGPEFFAKAKNDYASFTWALVREFFQNSIDAPGSDQIDVIIATVEGNVTQMTVKNNGAPMSKETLVGKLLSLGGSGKGFQGTVGGFGKAKEVLYFCHKSYQIHTGDMLVQGSGAGYNLHEGCPEVLDGTQSTIVMDRNLTSSLVEDVKRFASYAQWDGAIVLNGERLDCKLKKGSPRREFEWGTVYTNKAIPHRVIVRVGGIPMFSHRTELDRTVIVELKGASVDVLTSNRDGLVWKFEDEFDTFLMDLVTNKSKALKAQNPTYTHFSGAKFKASKENPERKLGGTNARSIVGDVQPVLAAFAGRSVVPQEGGGAVFSSGRVGVLGEVLRQLEASDELVECKQKSEPSKTSVVSEFFVIKNETTLKVPDHYQPGAEQFGAYSKKLARMWGRLVIELHRMYELENEFGIGFVFSEDAEAQYEQTNRFGVVYYLNPVQIVGQSVSLSKSFKKRFALTERDRILAIAVHEFVHGLGYDSHNESYAAKLTEVFSRVLKERKRFNWCFA